MKASDILLTLELATLEVSKDCAGNVTVIYRNGYVEDGISLFDYYDRK